MIQCPILAVIAIALSRVMKRIARGQKPISDDGRTLVPLWLEVEILDILERPARSVWFAWWRRGMA